MAVFSGTIRSSVLGFDTHLQIILPFDRPQESQQSPCKVLYLLHGLGENCQAWCRYSAIERYARRHGIAVVMPEVQRSFYADMRFGQNYFTYVTTELPDLCRQMFHISAEQQDTFVAGLSMGGYAALKCAFAYPERYAGVASFSGAVDIHSVVRDYANHVTTKEFIAVLGTDLSIGAQDDVFRMAEEASRSPACPRVLMTCGEQDYLWNMNTKLRDHLQKLPIDFSFHSWDGVHDWDFWDPSIRLALDFFLGQDLSV